MINIMMRTATTKYSSKKNEYPDLFRREPMLFFSDIKQGICDRTTICAHIIQGQKKERKHDGIKLFIHENKLDCHLSRGTPAISKLFWGRSNRRAVSFPSTQHSNKQKRSHQQIEPLSLPLTLPPMRPLVLIIECAILC